MSTGRHARKRAAQAEERLAHEQETLLAKEEKKKGELQKDVESQRIATMRARFGGQVPDSSVGNAATDNTQTSSTASVQNKYRTPTRLSGQQDPMRRTIMGMMLGNDQQG